MKQDINYPKEVLTSLPNYIFLAVMVFLMIAVNFWGFFALGAAGELAVFLASFSSYVQRIIYLKCHKNDLDNLREAEKGIIASLGANYREDFRTIQSLCDRIEKRAAEVDGAQETMGSILERLTTFRYEYARRLRMHYLLTATDRESDLRSLNGALEEAQHNLKTETSARARQSWSQTVDILKKRINKTSQVGARIREVEAQLKVVKNLLGLLYDDIRTSTEIADMTSMVDNLIAKLEISEELRDDYEDLETNPEAMKLPIKAVAAPQTMARQIMNQSRNRQSINSK